MSRIAQGKLRLQKEPVDLADMVQRTVDDHRSVFASKGVSLEFQEGMMRGVIPKWRTSARASLAIASPPWRFTQGGYYGRSSAWWIRDRGQPDEVLG